MWPTGVPEPVGVVRVPNWFRKFTSGHRTGLCGWHTGLETSVWSVERAPYRPIRTQHGLANPRKISRVGLYGAQWQPWVHVYFGYIYQAKLEYCHLTRTGPSRLPRGILRAQNRRKPMSECYVCSASSHGYTIHPYGSKHLQKNVRVLVWDPVKPASARTGYINQVKPEYMQFTPSWKLLRIKVTPDLHLTYSKNGGNLGLVLKMKNIACISILLTTHV